MDIKDRMYHVTEDQTPLGPFSFEELKRMNIADKSLIWYKGLSEWTPLNDLPDLQKALNKDEIPPPLPENEPDQPPPIASQPVASLQNKTIKSTGFLSKKSKQFIILWITLHLFALITSYSRIDAFSSGTTDSSEFWPFVNFKSCGPVPQSAYYNDDDTTRMGISQEERNKYCGFTGVFSDYDWSEFAIYMTIPILIVVRRVF